MPKRLENMPHLKMTDAQFREHVVARLAEGDRRFGQIEERQEVMRAEIKANTALTQQALDVSKQTDGKVGNLISEVHTAGEERHRENIDRMATIEQVAREAKGTAEKMQKDIAGLLAIYDGGKTGVKVVKGLAVGVKGIILYGAGVALGVSVIAATVGYWFGKVPALPPLFGH